MSEVITGWGHVLSGQCTTRDANGPDAVAVAIAAAGPRGVLPRGAGRSYGDAAINSDGEVLHVTGGGLRLDPRSGVLDAPAAASMQDVFELAIPAGWMPPAVPGTAAVTVGGAIAADVHGKDQRGQGNLGAHVRSLTLVDGCGECRELGPGLDSDAFWATVGGMGLTGAIISARIQLTPIETSALKVRTQRFWTLEELLAAMDEPGQDRYCVAWFDAVGTRRATRGWAGRGMVEWAEHARLDELPHGKRDQPLAYRAQRSMPVPPLPMSVVSGPLVRRYNHLRFARTPARSDRIAPLGSFFHQLDALRSWYRLYGPYGLRQYHVLIPPTHAGLIRHIVECLQHEGIPPLLAVLKRHGPSDLAPLTFPADGWGLALDLPASHPQVEATLCALDKLVAAAGGRVYLAKDSCLGSGDFAAMYPRLDAWRATRDRLDPHGRLRSDLGRRLGLCP